MMRRREFERLLAAWGADRRRWPPERRGAADRLIAADAGARARLADAERLDARLARVAVADDPEACARIAARLARLPPQHRALRWWPALLSRWDFQPAWPRVVALATVAMLGVLMGIGGADPFLSGAQGSDLSPFVFDPGPGVGLGIGPGVPR